jgi:hypothetical protein
VRGCRWIEQKKLNARCEIIDFYKLAWRPALTSPNRTGSATKLLTHFPHRGIASFASSGVSPR